MIHYVIQTTPQYNSTAAYNRVRLLYDGFVKNGYSSKLHLLIIPDETSFLKKCIVFVKCLFMMLSLLMIADKTDIVIFYGETLFSFMYKWFSRKTNLVVERLEYPYFMIIENLSPKLAYISKKNLKDMCYASSMITCSSFLEKYYCEYVKDIYICPLVVKLNEFEKRRKEKKDEYIAYCGSFDNNKDGIPVLLKAFSIFHKQFSDVKLVLIGTGAEESLTKLKELIRKEEIDNCVEFTGLIPHSEIGDWLANAVVLALARPNNKQAEGGIPSKVGEYLASGVPCVLTKTGDLSNYLQDGVDCFLCAPDSVEAFAERLKDCYLSNRSLIGQQGKIAAKQFDYECQAKKVAQYFENRYNIIL